MTNVLVLVGSLRADSINRKLAEAADAPRAGGHRAAHRSTASSTCRSTTRTSTATPRPPLPSRSATPSPTADAVLLITPEYNGTIPAVLKNALDWGSRPFGASPLSGKPLAVIGSAFGQYGGVWAHDDARKAAGIAGAKVLEDVKVAIPQSVVRFAETHPREDAEVTTLVQGALTALAEAAAGTDEQAAA